MRTFDVAAKRPDQLCDLPAGHLPVLVPVEEREGVHHLAVHQAGQLPAAVRSHFDCEEVFWPQICTEADPIGRARER